MFSRSTCLSFSPTIPSLHPHLPSKLLYLLKFFNFKLCSPQASRSKPLNLKYSSLCASIHLFQHSLSSLSFILPSPISLLSPSLMFLYCT
ncbi:hypothetical protein BT96DRAFT_623947 [Gymnopus androsaceus JB14]|uniref:Uncharacterized protein n=1 Tax=Gymnopus androsaceus JB14 TaxID=1447944 RepID=A0A6A4IHT5_9AGAR|nr:hypothetical protein BT96DRAFT_623947 [Gymnopus androsaceus JB14]